MSANSRPVNDIYFILRVLLRHESLVLITRKRFEVEGLQLYTTTKTFSEYLTDS